MFVYVVVHCAFLLALLIMDREECFHRFTVTILLLNVVLLSDWIIFLVCGENTGLLLVAGLLYTCLFVDIVATMNKWIIKEIVLKKEDLLTCTILLWLSTTQLYLLTHFYIAGTVI